MEITFTSAIGVPGVGEGDEDGPDPWRSGEEKGLGGIEAKCLGDGWEEERELEALMLGYVAHPESDSILLTLRPMMVVR